MKTYRITITAVLAGLSLAAGCQRPAREDRGAAFDPYGGASQDAAASETSDSLASLAGAALAIQNMLREQADCWNRGDIDCFMSYYWRSDDLSFSSGGETRRGWEATRQRFREAYPTLEAMGHLTFDDVATQFLGQDVALVLGNWALLRDATAGGHVGGNFTLVMQRQQGQWRIVHDHTSRAAEE